MPAPLFQPELKLPALLVGGRMARRSRAGFTLIELAVTLTVLMLAAAVAVPGFVRFQEASQLQWTVRRTLALAGEARGLAVSGNQEVSLEFDPGAHGLRLVIQPSAEGDEPDANPEAEPPLGERRTPDARFLPFPLDLEVKVEGKRAEETTAVRFYPDGRAEEAKIRLERFGFQPVVLGMNPRTGRMRIEERPE